MNSFVTHTTTQPTVESLTDYYPFGMAMPGRSYNASAYRFGYTGHEKEGDLAEGVYTTQYRLLDTRLGHWMSVDPLFGKYPDMGAYNYCGGNPVGCWDPDGRNPIFNEEGALIGVTEDSGLQGNAFFMDNKSYNPKMDKIEAQKKDKGEFFLKNEEAKDKYLEKFSKLNQRPDWDGYLTLEEANKWYREGNGEPLFVSLEKINLDGLVSLGEEYVGETYTFNLLYGASFKANDGLVYGNLTFKRYPNHTCRAYADKYDFDYKSWLDPFNWPRNLETFIGDIYAGDGKGYTIFIYGEKKLEPLLP